MRQHEILWKHNQTKNCKATIYEYGVWLWIHKSPIAQWQSIQTSYRQVIASTPVGRTWKFFRGMPVPLTEKSPLSYLNLFLFCSCSGLWFNYPRQVSRPRCHAVPPSCTQTSVQWGGLQTRRLGVSTKYWLGFPHVSAFVWKSFGLPSTCIWWKRNFLKTQRVETWKGNFSKHRFRKVAVSGVHTYRQKRKLRAFSNGQAPVVWRGDNTTRPAPVIQKPDNFIHSISHYPA